MLKIFFMYRPLIINVTIVLALIIALLLNYGNAKDFFLGVGTGAALVNLGISIKRTRARQTAEFTHFENQQN